MKIGGYYLPDDPGFIYITIDILYVLELCSNYRGYCFPNITCPGIPTSMDWIQDWALWSRIFGNHCKYKPYAMIIIIPKPSPEYSA